MEIESGNAGSIYTRDSGWFIGFSDWARAGLPGVPDLRYMPKGAPAHTIHVKWMSHPAGDDRGTAKPPSEGRTISILVSETGTFRIEFSADADFPTDATARYTLQKHGDFVIWGENLHHRWFVDEPCVILTIRWIPMEA